MKGNKGHEGHEGNEGKKRVRRDGKGKNKHWANVSGFGTSERAESKGKKRVMAVAAVHNRRALTTTAAWRAMRDSQSAA